ncbi:hypothetical protein QWY87_09510 [Lutimonas halocynthiae]|uniref:hypothetical protein n=1 Tax=Lutimonas halocynthiae TaxID=1446477 RepID=UPI0025B38E13|nr:hypothetical protein [Lutimonas halocynthiae]MDN3642936.1 hypothetical protein [Lutimonas halocynthiae]
MSKIKNTVIRYLILFTCIGLLASISNCTSDDKDDEIVNQTFLEKQDGTKWKITEDEGVIYMRINNNMNKPIELWISEIEFEKGMVDDDCYYYSDDLLEIEEMEILENSANNLTFTYLGNETWTLTIENNRLKMVFTNMSGLQDAMYMDKANDDVDSFEICAEEFKLRLGE